MQPNLTTQTGRGAGAPRELLHFDALAEHAWQALGEPKVRTLDRSCLLLLAAAAAGKPLCLDAARDVHRIASEVMAHAAPDVELREAGL